MRPQDLYPRIGECTTATRSSADELALVRAECELWDADALRVDSGAPWSAAETHSAVLDDLSAAEAALLTAAGRLEAAWAALGRLSAD